MLSIKKQISILYISSVLQNLSLTGAWIAILAARGFSLVEIGFVETVFHITSFLFEIPSGVLADLYGRKNMMIVSSVYRNDTFPKFTFDMYIYCIFCRKL